MSDPKAAREVFLELCRFCGTVRGRFDRPSVPPSFCTACRQGGDVFIPLAIDFETHQFLAIDIPSSSPERRP